MKFCLIGCGGIAISSHGPAYARYRDRTPGFELAACCDTNAERAREMGSRFGFARAYDSYEAMLLAEKPDAVAVVVSEAAAAKVGMDVLRRGIPMFIEKPPGQYSTQTAALAAEAARGSVPNQVAFNRRYMPVLEAMRAEIAKSDAEIQSVCYDFYRVERFDEHFSDTAIHGIDTVRYLCASDYEQVRFAYQEMPQYGPGVCNIYMDCVMQSGVQAQLRFCPVTGVAVERATVHLRGQSFLAYTPVWGGFDSPGRVECFRANRLEKVISGDDLHGGEDAVYITNGFYREIEAFFDGLQQNLPLTPTIAESLNTMLVKECIDRREEAFLSNMLK